MELPGLVLAAFWLPLLVLVAAVLAYGVRRDRGRNTKATFAVAAACVLVLTATTAFAGWGAYQQQRAERDACAPTTGC